MSNKLTILAKIEAQADQVERVKAELQKLIAPTLEEAGCIQYDLHQDNDNPAVFVFYETWESRERWQVHMNNTPLAEFIKATEAALVSLTVNEMTKV